MKKFMQRFVPNRATHPNRRPSMSVPVQNPSSGPMDEWGAPISTEKLASDKAAAQKVAIAKEKSDKASAMFSSMEKSHAEWLKTPEGQRHTARQNLEYKSKLQGPSYVEGLTGRGGYSRTYKPGDSARGE